MKKKAEKAKKLGIASEVIHFEDTVTEAELEAEIIRLNQDPSVHAILLQLPLPNHLEAYKFQLLTLPEKDVDGFHP